ncbi:FKBP-type peptidyl-prolyl cis-trans isomerase [soil metagenome]
MSVSTPYRFKKRVPVRKLVSVVLAAGLLASLAACTSTPQAFSNCDNGSNAALVTAKGTFGDDPKAEFPTPLVSKKAQLSVATSGDGAAITSADGIDVTISIYVGKTGEALPTQSGPITGVKLRLFVAGGTFPFTEALTCATEGSRVVTTGTAKELFGPDALGIDPTETLVVVSDVQDRFLGKPDGADQVPQAGYPSVSLAPNGQAGLTFGSSDVPDGLGAIALKQGDGATVKKGDSVIANVTGVIWGGTSTFDSTWDNKAPRTVTAADLDADGVGLVPGLAKAVIGQKVGSQLLVVVSPEDGFGTSTLPAGVTATDTLVYVFDILGIAQ